MIFEYIITAVYIVIVDLKSRMGNTYMKYMGLRTYEKCLINLFWNNWTISRRAFYTKYTLFLLLSLLLN